MSGKGIEHRTVDTVLQAYHNYDCPNFSIWAGREMRVRYDGGNVDEGSETLITFLNTVLQSGTQTIYMLRVYPETTENITNSTAYAGSTTFMLSPTALTRIEPGPGGVGSVHYIDRTGKTDPAAGKEFMTRLDRLEAENKALLEKLHTEQLNGLRRDFTAQIAGIQKVEEDKHWTDRLMDLFDKKPEMVDKIFDGVGKIAGIFREQKNYIVNPAGGGGSMAGTSNKTQPPAEPGSGDENSEEMDTTTEMTLTPEGALINPLLTAEERQLKKKEQGAILVTRLEPLTQDQHDDLQSDCLEIIEKRVSAVTLSRMLLAVAGLDNDDLNKLLNNLD